jgi:uncharacterized membrane protein YfcA
LVNLLKINPENATSYSLFIIGITSMVGSYRHYKLGNLKIKSALIFAIPTLFSLFLIRKIIFPIIPKEIILINNFVV